MWDFNMGLMTDIVEPTSRVYRFLVAKPVRTSIGNFGTNLKYPGRLVNNLLQGKWLGARDESYRFVCNTTVGLAGLFDPGTRWHIPNSQADFGQTFGQWGWNPRCFIMLPVFGPSNERDTVGLAADTAANPLLYLAPYDFQAENPLTYLGPYTYFTYADLYNSLSDTVRESVRFNRATADSYSELQYAWSFARASRPADFQLRGKTDPTSLQTMEAAFFTYQDPDFLGRAQTRATQISATGKELKFTYWLHPGKAPVVYIAPGLGAHRLDKTSVALAELASRKGYSAVSVSSPFNPEFMEHASTAALPAYLPVDGHDLQVALTEIDRYLDARHPGRLGKRILLGYSMGAMYTLYVAATARTNTSPLMQFDHYVAINPPVRLLHGVAKLDEFYRAPMDWPAKGRKQQLENTLLKVAALRNDAPTAHPSLPFNAVESRFLIGLLFRFELRDILYSSQRRASRGVLRQPMGTLHRAPVYQEIMQYSYQDYFDQFAVPYYASRNIGTPTAAALDQADDLRTYEANLRGNPDIRVLVNQNDFLLDDDDLRWFRSTIVPEQLWIFAQGGHLGNLSHPNVQQAILDAISGQK